MDVIHFNRTVQAGELVGRGCFPACTVPQPTLARPKLVYMLHVLIDFWFVRSRKNFFFFKTMPPCSPNPEPSVLFWLTKKGNHSSRVAKACAAQNAVLSRRINLGLHR